MAEFRDGVFAGDFGFLVVVVVVGSEEGADVEARQGFDLMAVSFSALELWRDFFLNEVG